jgi:formate dehydrogenase major subunit
MMVRAKLNGAEHEFDDGISILDAARELKIEIPALCGDARLKPVGACRLCLVEIKGETHETAACMRALTGGMEIETHSPRIERARKTNLRMLAQNYPLEAFQKFPEKHFHHLAKKYGLTDADFCGDSKSGQIDDSHTYISVDMSRCVDCYNCVRVCDEVQGQFVWQKLNRGLETHIVPDSFGKFGDSSACVSCGACADVCPSGALEDKSFLKNGAPTSWTKTVCPYCGTGCEMNVGTLEDRIVQIKPNLETPVNRGHLCVKGRYAFNFVDAADRATEPMIRTDGEWKKVSWQEAIDFTAKRLKKIVENYGKESVAVLGSARATNEENYLAQKFARVCLETNNVDCCARVCHTPTAAAMKMTLGTGAATNSFDDIEMAKTILVCGANPTENHPVIGARIKQAVLKGAKLIVIDPRRIELAKYADVHLPLRPGTNVLLFNALAHAIIEEELYDQDFVKNRVLEFEEFRSFVSEYSPEKVAPLCGVDAEIIRQAARIYAVEKPAMCVHGLGMTEHLQGTEGVMTIVNLALLTGNLGKRGAGVNPLRGQNNVQGAAHMGCDPGILTGSISLDDGRASFEKIWNAAVPIEKGLNQLQMMDAAAKGKLKALWAIGYDVFLSNANAEKTEKSFRKMELVIVQDLFLNETARHFANVFFPACSSFEKDGTFMNAERRVSRVRKAVEPRGNSRSDWEIICDLARAMGKGEFFDFHTPEEIWNEIRAVWKQGSGITYERIEQAGLQWGCPEENHPGTEVLHGESFASSRTAALRRIKYIPTKETLSEEFPFLLTTGRTLYQFNAGTMTLRTPNVEIRPTDTLDVSETDAENLRLSDGENVRLKSRYGEAYLPVRVSSAVKPGELFATFHTAQVFLNRLTSPYRDRLVQAPEFKVTAVRIEKLADS